jgi:hypothetical protein
MLGVPSSSVGRTEGDNPLNLSRWIELVSIPETKDELKNISYYYNEKHVSKSYINNLTSEISRWRS